MYPPLKTGTSYTYPLTDGRLIITGEQKRACRRIPGGVVISNL